MSLEHSPSKLAYSIAGAVQVTSIGRSKLYEEIKSGRLKTFKVGTRTLIATADLMAWLATYRSASVEAA